MPNRAENLYTSLKLYDDRFLDDPGNWGLVFDGHQVSITWRNRETRCEAVIYDHNGKFSAYPIYHVPFTGFSPATRWSPGGSEFSGVYEITDWQTDEGELTQKDGESDFAFVERCINWFDEDPPDEEAVPSHITNPEPDEDDEDEDDDYYY